MISVVKLRNWRAYRFLELELEPGTTFLVARNGVGKTSLVDSVRWALDPSVPARLDMLHDSADSGSVEVELTVNAHHVRVRRSLTKGRGRTPRTEIDGWIDRERRGER